MLLSQQHLPHKIQVDFGSFYTPPNIVHLLYDLLRKNINDISDYTIVDSSCGYGSFLLEDIGRQKIGADIDEIAIKTARQAMQDVLIFKQNALNNISRMNYKIAKDEKLIMVGNPPYNDRTSMLRQNIKDKSIQNAIDEDVKTRDLGMSFLLSYNKLQADYVCVLHPLSYLIKKANFSVLSKFAQNYRLLDGIIISSHEFSDTSRGQAFPILIGLYKRTEEGMDYNFVRNYRFSTKEGRSLCLHDFDTIGNYISKYPNKKSLIKGEIISARFYTLRDINALKRNQTFIERDTANTIYVTESTLPYYCYVDIFKRYADKLPYYFGNCDIPIDRKAFEEIKACFVAESFSTNPVLRKRLKHVCICKPAEVSIKIERYFEQLLGRV